jgi:hypothetical protein
VTMISNLEALEEQQSKEEERVGALRAAEEAAEEDLAGRPKRESILETLKHSKHLLEMANQLMQVSQ